MRIAWETVGTVAVRSAGTNHAPVKVHREAFLSVTLPGYDPACSASYIFEDDLRPRTPFAAIYAYENRYSSGWGKNRGTIFVVVEGFGRVGTFAKTETHNGGTKNIEDKHLKPMVKDLKTEDKNLRHFGSLRGIVSPRFFRKFKNAVA